MIRENTHTTNEWEHRGEPCEAATQEVLLPDEHEHHEHSRPGGRFRPRTNEAVKNNKPHSFIRPCRDCVFEPLTTNDWPYGPSVLTTRIIIYQYTPQLRFNSQNPKTQKPKKKRTNERTNEQSNGRHCFKRRLTRRRDAQTKNRGNDNASHPPRESRLFQRLWASHHHIHIVYWYTTFSPPRGRVPSIQHSFRFHSLYYMKQALRIFSRVTEQF